MGNLHASIPWLQPASVQEWHVHVYTCTVRNLLLELLFVEISCMISAVGCDASVKPIWLLNQLLPSFSIEAELLLPDSGAPLVLGCVLMIAFC